MSFTNGATFVICGAVVRKYVPESGKVAFLTVAVRGQRGRERKIDLKAFGELVGEVGALGAGQTVSLTGDVDYQILTDRKRNNVMVDGRECWVPSFVIRKVDVEGSSRRPDSAPSGQATAATPTPASKSAGWDDAPEPDFSAPDESDIPF